MMETKMAILKERRRNFSGDLSYFSQSDLAHFLLLEALGSELPELKHLYVHQKISPEKMYLCLARTAGRLKVFHDDEKHVIPPYEHTDLTKTFSSLEALMKILINVVLPTRLLSIKLMRENSSLYASEMIDSELLAGHRLYLAVSYPGDGGQWVSRFSQHIKIGAREKIDTIIASALPGIHITPIQRLPAQLPVKIGYEYFQWDQHGVYWDQVCQERTFAIFTSKEFENAKIEIAVLKDDA
jgi:type VI secretion system protein ImpJ